MKIATLITLLGLLPSLAVGQEHFVYETQDATGTIRYVINEVELTKTPSWSPATAPPPLSIKQAVAVATKHVKAARPSDLLVTAVELHAVRGGAELRWYYLINMYDQQEAYGPEPPRSKTVLILMDGTVVKPRLVKKQH